MGAPVLSRHMEETRGQAAKRRRVSLGVSRDAVAHEAGVSVKTVKTYEDDARANMPSAPRIEAALDRMEERRDTANVTPHRRATDTPERRIIDATIEGVEGKLTVHVLGDGTRAIFIVPEGGRAPTAEEIERVLRSVRGE